MRASALALLLLAACGDEATVDSADAGAAPLDALVAEDASSLPDALAAEDASSLPDALAAKDASSLPDALAAEDASSPDAAPPSGPRLYPEGARHSPLDEALAARLREVVLAHPAERADVFAKVGDSITVSTSFLACFAGSRFDLGGRAGLEPTRAHFLAGDAGGADPYQRTSLAAGVGWSANRPIAGSPSLLDQELDAIHPRYAPLMYGTNDVGFRDYDSFARDMVRIVDVMLAHGTIPLLSSIPPRDDDAAADARVGAFGGLARAIALSRELPFSDYHRELLPLPAHGLAGDGVHPRGAPVGACALTPDGLMYGANVRNLLVLEALDRARRAVEGEPAPDAPGPRLTGSGTRADPFRVPALPFSAAADTRARGIDEVSAWTACAPQDESGPELRYRFTLAEPARVTAVVASGAGADLDVHLVRAGGGADACIARGDREASAQLAAGDYDVVVDTFMGRAGELFLDVR